MSKTIYIVQGSKGEYSDHKEWLVRAFTSKKRAQEMVIECTKQGNVIRQHDTKLCENGGFDESWALADITGDTEKKRQIANRLGIELIDYAFKFDHWSGFNYTVLEVDCEGLSLLEVAETWCKENQAFESVMRERRTAEELFKFLKDYCGEGK